MKTKIKNHKIIFGTILLILMAIVISISNFVVNVMTEKVEPNKASAYNFSFGDVASLGVIVGDTNREIIIYDEDPITEREIYTYNVVDGHSVPPIISEGQLYCADMDKEFWTGRENEENEKYKITKFTKVGNEYGSITHYMKPNPHTVYYHKTSVHTYNDEHTDKTYDGETTYPWLVNQGDIDLLSSDGIDLAYILTSPDIGQYSEDKQRAIWARNGQRASTQLSKEAEQYKEYYEATQKKRGSTALPDLNIQGSADDLKVLAHYDGVDGGTYTIGPINLTYINKNGDDVAFGGIADMYCRGYNKEGEQVGGNIQIQKFIDNQGTYSPDYFNPDRTAGHESFVDLTDQAYPDGSGYFYIVIDNPNAGKLSTDEDFIFEIDIKIVFEWMTIWDAKASDVNTYEYKVYYDDTNHSDSDEHEEFRTYLLSIMF